MSEKTSHHISLKMMKNYKKGLSLRECAALFEKSPEGVRLILKRNNIKIRKPCYGMRRKSSLDMIPENLTLEEQLKYVQENNWPDWYIKAMISAAPVEGE